MNNENFSAVHSKLEGALLIEASAGTGKTYSLMHVLLRLIVEKNIPIERILLVTFTKAATQEMRFRLRSLLINTVQKLEEGGEISDKTLKDQLEEWLPDGDLKKKKILIDRMKKALEGLEDISVETIHAFCQKMLNNYGFSSGKIAESEVGEDSDIIHKVLDEQMRKYTRLNPDNGLLFMALPEGYLETALKGVLGMPDDPDYGDFKVCLNTTKISGSNISLKYYRQKNLSDIENTLKVILKGLAKDDDVNNTVKELLNDATTIENIENIVKKLLKQETKIKGIRRSITKLSKDAEKISTIENTVEQIRNKKNKELEKVRKKISDNFVEINNIENIFKNLLNDAEKIEDVKNTLREPLIGSAKFDEIEDIVKNLLRDAAKEVKLVKEELRLMTFDDMLVRMYEEVKHNPSFAEVVRSQFDAVLIDEFQDTDPMQYKIFSILFLDKLFLNMAINEKNVKRFVGFVGDPKQSIYRFRSADLATYIDASKRIGRTETLTKNYRSFSGIVYAINEFFSLSLETDDKHLPLLQNVNGLDEEIPAFPFGQINLPFFVSHVGKKKLPLLKKVVGGYEALPAFEMWWNTPESKNYGAIGDARKDIDEMVACDIDRLLNDKVYIYDDSLNELRRIRPSDIAILVERRSDANGVEEALKKKRIRSLRSSRGNVFDTEERDEILAVLKALEEPENSRCITTARATRIFNESLETILTNEDLAQEDRQLIDYLKTNYSKFGLSKTFKELFKQKHTVENLLPLKNGERILANYEHLIEILHAQSKTLQSLPGLIRWFDKEDSGDAADNGDRSVRRESDDDVVQVETIHKSKGLEYPIVYLPGAIRKRKKDARDFKKFFLNQEDRNNLFFYADTPKDDDPIKKEILKEQDNEANRLAYVAMTRASSRLVIPFLQKFKNDGGAYKDSFCNAYGRILGGNNDEVNSYRDKLSYRFGLMQKDIKAEVQETFKEKIGSDEKLIFSENVAVVKEGAPLNSNYERPTKEEPILGAEKPNSRSPQWLQSSFSAIVRGLHSEIEYKGMDEGEEESRPEGSADPDTLSFGGGPAFGDFLHRFIEITPFDLGREEKVEELTERVSNFFKMNGQINEDGEPDPEKVNAIVRMFQEITQVELFDGIQLISVDKKEKSPELEFLLGGIGEGKNLSVAQLTKALKKLMPDKFKKGFQPEDKMISGYLTGSMDMVFFAKEKYWLIDWKSNFAREKNGDLVKDANGYTPERINALMDKNFYHLQYLLYLVGLRRFLNLRLNVKESYDLIGGVGYVFLRGVRADKKDQAIFRYRPPLELILALDDLLTNGYDEKKIEDWKHQLEKTKAR